MEQKKLYCHFCGIERENPQQSKCSRCGTLFVEICSRCGEPVKKGRDNCIKCGLSIDKMLVPPPGMRVVSESEQIRKTHTVVTEQEGQLSLKKIFTALSICLSVIIIAVIIFNVLNAQVPDYRPALNKGDFVTAYKNADGDMKTDIAWASMIAYMQSDYIGMISEAWYCGWWEGECKFFIKELDGSYWYVEKSVLGDKSHQFNYVQKTPFYESNYDDYDKFEDDWIEYYEEKFLVMKEMYNAQKLSDEMLEAVNGILKNDIDNPSFILEDSDGDIGWIYE